MRLLVRLPLLLLSLPLWAADPNPPGNDLIQQGFTDMYNLSFSSAHGAFQAWEKLHPENPEGAAFDAAAYLFSEFNRLKILQSQFFVNNHSFFDLQRPTPNGDVKAQFEQALSRSQALAGQRLEKSPDDRAALFADVLSQGLHADYLALIEKQNLAALKEIKLATQTAQELLKIDPDCYDAYIASGIENYLLSQKPAPVRWLIQATGGQTDRQAGIADLRMTATKGRYLKPYAQLLLAVAALRDNKPEDARNLLADLANHFPKNPLYRDELAKIH